MGTCYKLLAIDVKRTLDLDKLGNHLAAWNALRETATWTEQGCEVTPASLRQAAAVAALEPPDERDDADDIVYYAQKLLKSAVWMERISSKLALFVSDTEDDLIDHYDWPEDEPHREATEPPR